MNSETETGTNIDEDDLISNPEDHLELENNEIVTALPALIRDDDTNR